MTVGEKLRYFRQNQGISLRILEEMTGIHEQTIKQYELGYRRPKLEQLKKLADGLHISVIEFLDIEIKTEADMVAMLRKVSPFFRWKGMERILEGERKN